MLAPQTTMQIHFIDSIVLQKLDFRIRAAGISDAGMFALRRMP
ncbi:hypothetical protein [Bradyrhizobium sp. ORS 285]|nr:hypothetical protein [Bradyrhizobium sp. ORS 285]